MDDVAWQLMVFRLVHLLCSHLTASFSRWYQVALHLIGCLFLTHLLSPDNMCELVFQIQVFAGFKKEMNTRPLVSFCLGHL